MDLPTINVLSLATGGGGLDLGVEAAFARSGLHTRTVASVEIEAYACAVLVSRMEEGRLAPCPVWTDLRSFDGRPFAGLVDLVVGGYPCQPFSVAGQRRGADDPRHLWPHVARIVREVSPRACFFENVAGHLSLGGHEVIRELQGMGYRVACGLFTAKEVGAPHKRERLFILAHRERGELQRRRGSGELEEEEEEESSEICERERDGDSTLDRSPALADDDDDRREGERGGGLLDGERAARRGDPHGRRVPWPPRPDDESGWRAYLDRWPTLEPAVRRGSHGLAYRLDRLRLLGNGVIPEQAAFALDTLAQALSASTDT